MAKNLYLCLVNFNSSADIVIKADSEQEAKTIAEKLVNSGINNISMSESDTGDASISDVHVLNNPDDDDREQAEENSEAWNEYREENAVEMDKDGKLIEDEND